MACFVPFNSRNLDTSLFVFRPTVVLIDELVEALKHFSLCTENLGCVHSAIFRSIHGNMIIWYGAWMKRSNENRESLTADLLSMLTKVSSVAILIDHSFFDAFAGESRDGSPAAKFSTGDIVSMNAALLNTDDISENDLSYACLAIYKSHITKMEGASAGVCLKSQSKPRIIAIFIWKSLQSCYSWILNADYRKTILPYFDGVSIDLKYDIFRVVYVSGDNVLNVQFIPLHQILENSVESRGSQISMLTNVSSMAILIDHSFFDAFAGESSDGSPAAKFSTGDTISMYGSTSDDISVNDLSYACLAIFKSRVTKMEGTTAGVCLKSQSKPRIIAIAIRKSLQYCYSWILNTDYRKTVLPYFDHVSIDLKYDIFRVVYVSGVNVLNFMFIPPHQMLENSVESIGSQLSMLTNVSSMAILIDHCFFNAFAGESRDGSPAAKFYTGDIISMYATFVNSDDISENDISYGCLAIFRSRFTKMEGATAGVCLKSQSKPRFIVLFIWKSLQYCYSWIINSDYRKAVLPYFDRVSIDLKYDIFRVAYVSGDNVLNFQFIPPRQMLENSVESKGSPGYARLI